MKGRALLLAALCATLAAAGCRHDRPRPKLTPEDETLLAAKAGPKIGLIIRENLPALFVGVVVFRSDVFLSESETLERADLPVLDSFGNAALILLNASDIPPLLQVKSVRKVYYLCRQAPLARIHPAFVMEILKRFGAGKENEPTQFLVRFREVPGAKERKFIEDAGFAVSARAGAVWSLSGPLAFLPRLLEDDRITYYEGASKARTM